MRHGLFLVNPSWVPAITASFCILEHSMLVKNSGVRTPWVEIPAALLRVSVPPPYVVGKR